MAVEFAVASVRRVREDRGMILDARARGTDWRRALCGLAGVMVGVGVLGAEGSAGKGPEGGKGERGKFPCPPEDVARYTAFRAVGPVVVDGRLDEETWRRAPESPAFVDILSGAPTVHGTRAMVTWDAANLYVGYRVEEPLVHAKFTKRNDPIYYDNDVELFIAGPDAYYEFEINAFNTRYEVFFIWEEAYERSGFAGLPEFARPRLQGFNGVGFTTHPRGRRLGNFQWTLPGLQTAVQVDGTVNKDDDRDRGWTVELALPWTGLELLTRGGTQTLPPKEGDVWRMDFSRFNTYKEAPPAKDSGGWVWTRHGIWDSHIPECFVHVRFSTNPVPVRVP